MNGIQIATFVILGCTFVLQGYTFWLMAKTKRLRKQAEIGKQMSILVEANPDDSLDVIRKKIEGRSGLGRDS